MIPDIFFEDPFPYNVSSEDLMDCFFSHNSEKEKERVINSFKKEDIEEINNLYSEMVCFYIDKNLNKKGDYILIHDAQPIIKATQDDGSLKMFFNEIGLDFSHLFGIGETDVKILIIPCSILKCKPEYLVEKLKKTNKIDFLITG